MPVGAAEICNTVVPRLPKDCLHENDVKPTTPLRDAMFTILCTPNNGTLQTYRAWFGSGLGLLYIFWLPRLSFEVPYEIQQMYCRVIRWLPLRDVGVEIGHAPGVLRTGTAITRHRHRRRFGTQKPPNATLPAEPVCFSDQRRKLREVAADGVTSARFEVYVKHSVTPHPLLAIWAWH